MRDLVRAGVPERAAMQLTAQNPTVCERYNIVSSGDLRDRRGDSMSMRSTRLDQSACLENLLG